VSEYVLVGCKLPHGLILEILEAPKPGEDFLKPRVAGHRVTLKGACSLYNQSTKKSAMNFDYAITPVEKSFWEKWYAINKDRDFIRNSLIFVADKQDRAEAIAKERTLAVKTGLEPLSQENDARMKRNEPNPAYLEPNL